MPVVPAPLVSPKTRSWNVRVAAYAEVRRPQSSPIGFSAVPSVVEEQPSSEANRSMRTRVMSGFLRQVVGSGGSGQVDGQPVGLAFGGGALFVEPQVQNVESARPQAHG